MLVLWSNIPRIPSVWINSYLFTSQSHDLLKAYPPFVNFFEQSKEALNSSDRTKPRFHAFLKLGQTNPKCKRQGLQELLIRPVQRLPSISLLLNGKTMTTWLEACRLNGQFRRPPQAHPQEQSGSWGTGKSFVHHQRRHGAHKRRQKENGRAGGPLRYLQRHRKLSGPPGVLSP